MFWILIIIQKKIDCYYKNPFEYIFNEKEIKILNKYSGTKGALQSILEQNQNLIISDYKFSKVCSKAQKLLFFQCNLVWKIKN